MLHTQGTAGSNARVLNPSPRPLTGKTNQRDPWLALAPIILLAAISALTYYLGFTRPFPLADNYQIPLTNIGPMTKGTLPSFNWWAIAWTITFAVYYLAFRICPPATQVSSAHRRVALAIICGSAALFCIFLLFMYPITADDLFDQLFRARITTHYAQNPFIMSPSAFADDPFLPYVAWKYEGSPYGPMWELLAAIPSWLAGDNLWNNLIFFKLLVIFAYGATTLLTYLILRTLKPEWALRGALLVAWNPLALFEVAGSGHNDAVMVAFLLLAIYLFVKGWRIWVLPALMAAVLTKFVPLLLVPIAIAALWRDRLRLDESRLWHRLRGLSSRSPLPATMRDTGEHSAESAASPRPPLSNREALSNLVIGSLLALGLAVVLYLPFWQGPQVMGVLNRQGLFTASLPSLTAHFLERIMGLSTDAAQGIARNAALVLVALTMIGLSLFVFLKGNARTVPERRALLFRTFGAFYELFFIYLAFATLWFQPWYLIWLVALTPLVALYTNANRTVIFSFCGVVNYFVWLYIWFWSKGESPDVTLTTMLLVYFPPIFYIIYTTLKPVYDRIWSPKISLVVDQQASRADPLSTRPVRSKP
ncbi:MAG TPA: hypothetical protein VJ183_11880 [Chloroflexia bacterium]|nr:hypothetical protein [Chloroflexia bacterium]